MANPCYTQIHPTCIPVSGTHQSKLTLMSESLRNDGRIWVPKDARDAETNPRDIAEEAAVSDPPTSPRRCPPGGTPRARTRCTPLAGHAAGARRAAAGDRARHRLQRCLVPAAARRTGHPERRRGGARPVLPHGGLRRPAVGPRRRRAPAALGLAADGGAAAARRLHPAALGVAPPGARPRAGRRHRAPLGHLGTVWVGRCSSRPPGTRRCRCPSASRMEPDARTWVERYLGEVCAGAELQHLGGHRSGEPDARCCATCLRGASPEHDVTVSSPHRHARLWSAPRSRNRDGERRSAPATPTVKGSTPRSRVATGRPGQPHQNTCLVSHKNLAGIASSDDVISWASSPSLFASSGRMAIRPAARRARWPRSDQVDVRVALLLAGDLVGRDLVQELDGAVGDLGRRELQPAADAVHGGHVGHQLRRQRGAAVRGAGPTRAVGYSARARSRSPARTASANVRVVLTRRCACPCTHVR